MPELRRQRLHHPAGRWTAVRAADRGGALRHLSRDGFREPLAAERNATGSAWLAMILSVSRG